MDFDFNIILVPITLVLGLIWLLDKVWFKQHKRSQVTQSAEVQEAQARLNQSQQQLTDALAQHNIDYDDIDAVVLETATIDNSTADSSPTSMMALKQAQREYRDAKRDAHIVSQMQKPQHENFLISWAHDYFPILAVVLIVRSFIIEPFNIPSSSMVPTLYTGDFVAVNKYAYGIRLPLTYQKILDTGSPERGDVVVFRYPKNPKIYYIKRVIGLPGDTVSFNNGTLTVNGTAIPSKRVDFKADSTLIDRLYTPVKGSDASREWDLSPQDAVLVAKNEEKGAHYSQETLGEHTYLRRRLNTSLQGSDYSELLSRQLTADTDWQITVPEESYFVMGDNSDRSKDGRFWGYVPDANLAGKAVYVWMHKKPGLTNLPTFQYNRSID